MCTQTTDASLPKRQKGLAQHNNDHSSMDIIPKNIQVSITVLCIGYREKTLWTASGRSPGDRIVCKYLADIEVAEVSIIKGPL